MFRVSNNLIGILNILSLILSIPILGGSWWLREHASSDCQKFIETPLLVVGGFLFLVSLIGLIGSCCRVSLLLWIYLFVTFVLILGLFVFTIFAIAVTNKGVGKVISGRGYKDYRLGDYSNWLQRHVVDGSNWVKTKSCLIETHVCSSLGNDFYDLQASQFYQKKFSPIQSGCCKPPTDCGFIYKNATFWVAPKLGPAVPDSDCTTWSNNQETLCYDCKSCKAGVLANLKKDWRKLAILNVSVIIILLIVYSVGCCALRNNREDNGYKRYRPYQP
ncbi:tetraspanin-8-like [Macadamia integrifolia]|uniref:tetraspanin-8-like n=1 Tax=Macadamia integrifolia TaxID=60698 RepID=UPI001C4FEE3A|nr:tetraspanin-8-like [Macadamia integrifolia]